MLKEKIKILGDRFKFYKPEATNMLSPTSKEYVITEDNIEELLESFNENPEIFVYAKHKGQPDEERKAIGKIKALRKLLDEIGLEADIEFNEDGIEVIENASKSPSVEMIGDILDNEIDEDNIVYLNKLKLTGLALVELPASEGVPIVASAILQLNGGIDKMENKKTLDELVKDFEATGEVSNEMLDLIKEDVEMLKLIVSKALGSMQSKTEDTTEVMTEAMSEDVKTEDTTDDNSEDVIVEDATKKEEDDKKELTASAWERALNKQAEKKGYLKASVVSVDTTYNEAKQLYRAGFNLSRVVSILEKDNRIKYISAIKSEDKVINLSAVQKDDAINEIKKLLK